MELAFVVYPLSTKHDGRSNTKDELAGNQDNMASVFTPSVVDRGFELRSGQTKD
jgi:hypothetical protein